MKTSISIKCGCGAPIKLEVSGTDDPKDVQCPKCHAAIWFVKPLGDFVGQRVLSRAFVELKAGDFTLVIVLSAMAVECELARLFIKWNEVDALNVAAATPEQRETWAEQWRKWNSISVRLEKASELLCNSDFNAFVSGEAELMEDIGGYPDIQQGTVLPKDFVIKELFHRRNKVVHLGEIDFKQHDGETAFMLAVWLFGVMKRMDDLRLAELNAKHAASLSGLSSTP